MNRRALPEATVAASDLDFLDLPFRQGDGVTRAGGEFEVERPWALVRYGVRTLNPGWWALDCEAESEIRHVELRMRSATDPLIIFRGENSRERIYLRGHEPFSLSLLVSPWPEKIVFRRLRLRRLGSTDAIRLYLTGAASLLTRGRAIERITALGQRFLAGQSLGVKVDLQSPAKSTEPPVVQPSVASALRGYRVERHGGVIAVLAHGDRLHRRAIECVEHSFIAAPEAKAAYGDLCEAGVIMPRPPWSVPLASRGVFPDAPIFFRRGAIEDSSAAPEALGRLMAQYGEQVVMRIPLPLAWRDTPLAFGLPPSPPPALSRTPRVSAIIPTKLRMDLLARCLDGLAERTGYPDLEVVVVNNASADPRLPEILDRAGQRMRVSTIDDHGDFNFPRLINAGVRASSGEIVLLLNDDVEPMESGWLHRIVDSALDEGVGAVGARLLYPDGAVQHAGVVMGIGGPCGHIWKFTRPEIAARNPHIVCPGRRLAVTGACLAARRTLFDAANGLDETHFPVAFNDVDFCLRLETMGFATIYRGDAVLIHHESQSRGDDSVGVVRRRRLIRETRTFLARWGERIEEDPYGSPAFDPATESGSTRLRPDVRDYPA